MSDRVRQNTKTARQVEMMVKIPPQVKNKPSCCWLNNAARCTCIAMFVLFCFILLFRAWCHWTDCVSITTLWLMAWLIQTLPWKDVSSCTAPSNSLSSTLPFNTSYFLPWAGVAGLCWPQMVACTCGWPADHWCCCTGAVAFPGWSCHPLGSRAALRWERSSL